MLFQKGHKINVGRKAWNKGLTKEIDERVRKYGKSASKTKKRLYKGGKSYHQEEWYRKKISIGNKGKKCSEETKRKQSKIKMGELNPMFGKKFPKELYPNFGMRNKKSSLIGIKLSKETRRKMSETRRRLFKEGKLKFPSGMFKKGHKWDKKIEENRIRNAIKGLIKRPTSYEKKISELCIENNLPFIYTGDGRFLINFKNPDFIDKNNKIVIEVFYSWFKIRDYGSIEKYKEFCRKKYNSSGWRVIFIDENEVNCDNWKEECLRKIQTCVNNL